MRRWRWLYAFRAWLGILPSRRADENLRDEIAFHLEMQVQENLRRGMTAEEATRRARIMLGGVDQTTEVVRDGRPLQMFTTLMQDVRYAMRLIRRGPGFAAVTVATIALGIGANTAIFSVVNGVLLRPLPFPQPDRLVRLYLANPAQNISDGTLSVPDLDDWRSRSRAFSSLAGYSAFPIIHTRDADPAEVQSAFVVGDFFGTLAVPALAGRALTEADIQHKARNVVVSERLWRTRFGGAPGVVGTVMVLGAIPYEVVGIMPSAFRHPAPDTDVWAPHSVLSDEAVGPRVQASVLRGGCR